MPSFFVEDPVEDDLVQWAHASHELPESFDWNNMYVKGFKMVVGGVPFAPAIIKKVVSNMVKKLDFDTFVELLKWANAMGMRTRWAGLAPRGFVHPEWGVFKFPVGTKVEFLDQYADEVEGTIVAFSDRDYIIMVDGVERRAFETDIVRIIEEETPAGGAAGGHTAGDESQAAAGCTPSKFEGFVDNVDITAEDDLSDILKEMVGDMPLGDIRPFRPYIDRSGPNDIPPWLTFKMLKALSGNRL